MVVASRLHHDSRYAGFVVPLEEMKKRFEKLADDEVELGAVSIVKWQWENQQVVFYKMSPEKIDKQYLSDIQVSFDAYRTYFALPPRDPRVAESWFYFVVLEYLV